MIDRENIPHTSELQQEYQNACTCELCASIQQKLKLLSAEVAAVRLELDSGNGLTTQDILSKVASWQATLSTNIQVLQEHNDPDCACTAEQTPEPKKLTKREMELLILLARGMIVKEIAALLVVSEKTVRNHLSNIYHKLGVYDRLQVVMYALRQGIISLDDA